MLQGPAVDVGLRADHAVRARFPEVDRAFALRLLKDGRVRIDGKTANLAMKAAQGSVVVVDAAAERLGPMLVPAFTVLHEDRGLVVVDKSDGVAMHEGQGVGEEDDVLTLSLLERFKVEEGFAGPSFLGRLDRPTSGLVVAALTNEALRDVEPAWRNGKIRKEYVVVVHGKTPPEGNIVIPLAARRARLKGTGVIEEARTSFVTVAASKKASVIVAELHTGRTHQIRRHLKAIGHPILGDPRYGDARRDADVGTFDGLLLHAWRLRHSGEVTRLPTSIEAPWPDRITRFVKILGLEAAANVAASRVAVAELTAGTDTFTAPAVPAVEPARDDVPRRPAPKGPRSQPHARPRPRG